MVAQKLQNCPVFIHGEWCKVTSTETSPVYNPSRGKVIAEVPMCDVAIVNEAVEAAADAFPAWRDTPPNVMITAHALRHGGETGECGP